MTLRKDLLRIIDANFNRSREGLRVCEDIARFAMDSNDVTKQLKSVRHGISDIVKSLPDAPHALLTARDSKGDVGKRPLFEIETGRKNLADVFTANMERSKESIRVLEEIFKLLDLKASAKLTRLRFKTYSIEKKAMVIRKKAAA